MSLIQKRRFLFEADDDASGGDGAAPAADTGTEGGDDTSSSDTNADAGNDNAEENKDTPDDGIEEPKDNDKDDDFNIEEPKFDDDLGKDDEQGGGDDNGGESNAPAPSADNGEAPVVDEDSLKAKDKELFDNLSEAEQKVKIRQQKEAFINLYSICDNVIEKYNSISMEYDDINEQIKNIISILFNNKKMIGDYLLNIYDSKSYIENEIMYNRYLAVLNSVKNISIELKNSMIDDNSKS